ISFTDAGLGTTVEVLTIDDKPRSKIHEGTQRGKVLGLNGKEAPEVNSYHRGHQLIDINIWTRKSLSNEERATLERLQDSPNFRPNPGKNDKSFFERMREYFE